jgi:hypothetical protein
VLVCAVIALLGLILELSVGIAFALCARDRVRVDGPFATPSFLLVLIFAGVVLAPATLYLHLAHTSWSWLYLVDPHKLPHLSLVPLLALHGGFLVGGWYLGARLLRADRRGVAFYSALVAALGFLISLPILGGRLGSYGSYADYRGGRAFGLFEVKLGYVLITLILAVGVSAGYVALELVRDSRRVRAR